MWKTFMYCSIVLVLMIAGCSSEVVSRDGEPDVFMVDEVDEQMNVAMTEARETINVFIEALQIGDDSSISIKGRFEEGDYVEHMWINNIGYDGEVFTGNLANEPLDLTNIKFGDDVRLGIDQVSDWMIVDESGMVTGGYTIRVLRDTMTEEEKQDFDSSTGLIFE